MNYGKDATEKRIKDASSKSRKYANKFFLGFFKTFLLMAILLVVVGTSVGLGMFKGIIDSAPESNIRDSPPRFTTVQAI